MVAEKMTALLKRFGWQPGRQPRQQEVISRFHQLFYGSPQNRRPWMEVSWLGVKALKCPLDLWIYQEILWDCRPDWIVECGTFQGGSALFLAGVCELIGAGQVISVDSDPGDALLPRPVHPRLRYVTGSTADPQVFAAVQAMVGVNSPCMVVLDSDHDSRHVAQELAFYSQLVTPGQYLVVEDTNLNGNPVRPDFGPGPAEAVRTFLAQHPDFAPDSQREKLYLTFNPGGYLKRS